MKILQKGDNVRRIVEHCAIQNSKRLREEEKEDECVCGRVSSHKVAFGLVPHGNGEEKMNLKETTLHFRTPFLA